MRKIIKIQFNRAIEGDPAARTEPYTPEASVSPKLKHASRIIITMLIIVVGIGTGWMGGRVLNNRVSHSMADAPASDAPEEDVLAESPTSPPSQSPTQHRSAVAAASSQPTPEAEQPVASPEPRLLIERELKAMERELRAVPPKPQKVDKDADTSETSTAEDPAKAKEIGREAFWKKLQELQRNRRGLANKNANEDQHN